MKEFLTKLITMNNDIDEKIVIGLYFSVITSIIAFILLFKTYDIKILYAMIGIISGCFSISTIHQVKKHKVKK